MSVVYSEPPLSVCLSVSLSLSLSLSLSAKYLKYVRTNLCEFQIYIENVLNNIVLYYLWGFLSSIIGRNEDNVNQYLDNLLCYITLLILTSYCRSLNS